MTLSQLSRDVLEDVPGNLVFTCILSAITGTLYAKVTGSDAYLQSAAIAAAIWFVVLMALTVRYVLTTDNARREAHAAALDIIATTNRQADQRVARAWRDVVCPHQWAYDQDIGECFVRRQCTVCGAREHVPIAHLQNAPYGDVEALAWIEDDAAPPPRDARVPLRDPTAGWVEPPVAAVVEGACDHLWLDRTSVGQVGRTERCAHCGEVRLDPTHGMDPETLDEVARMITRHLPVPGAPAPSAPTLSERLQPGAPVGRRRVIDISR